MRLYRHDTRLQDYFMQLQVDSLRKPDVSSKPQRATKSILNLAVRGAEKATRVLSRRRYKTDILFCPAPYFDRKTENRLTVNILLGLAQTGAKLLCLLQAGEPIRNELDAQLAAVGRTNQVEFVDPTASLNLIDARLRVRSARIRGSSTLREVLQILDRHELNHGTETQAGFEHSAFYVEAWERLAPSIEFETVVARCHWNTLCSSVCRTAQERGKQAITFQQGVIGHTLDVPVTASKYVSFGHSSASFLAGLNRRFFQSAGMAEPNVEYVPGGSLIDKVEVYPNRFDLKTLLVVDVQANPGDFYGVARQCQELIRLAERLLTADLPLRRLIIRPHPHWSDLELESLQRFVRDHSARCELSHPAWSLEDDLRRSSAAVGIFSGVLTVASACGLPTFFLKAEQGFMTEDLACFSSGQMLLPEDAFREIGKILSDPRAYAESRDVALRNARDYYENGTNLDFSASFFERLLKKECVTNQPELSTQ